MKKKWLALFLAIGTVFSSFACLTACDEKRGEEVTAKKWDTAFAYPNTENMTVETQIIYDYPSYLTIFSDYKSVETLHLVCNETEVYGKKVVQSSAWDKRIMERIAEDEVYESGKKLMGDYLFTYSDPFTNFLDKEGNITWELAKTENANGEFKKWKTKIFSNKYLYYDVYCLGIDMFTYDEEQGIYYKEWTMGEGDTTDEFRQEAVFKDGKLYEICTTMESQATKPEGVYTFKTNFKITFESGEITLPKEGELLGAILDAKKNEEK